MWKLLLVLGAILLMAAGGVYSSNEGDASKRRANSQENDRVATNLNHSLNQALGSSDYKNYDSASKVQVDHTASWFLAGQERFRLSSGLPLQEMQRPVNESRTHLLKMDLLVTWLVFENKHWEREI